jgi:hypothetical protein
MCLLIYSSGVFFFVVVLCYFRLFSCYFSFAVLRVFCHVLGVCDGEMCGSFDN